MWSHIFLTTALPLLLSSACPSPQVSIDISAIHEPIRILSDYSLSELYNFADASGKLPLHRPLGFYYASVANDVSITPPRADEPSCPAVITLNVILRLTDRNIEIARDLASIPCDKEAVLRHYRSHAAMDDVVFGLFAKTITKNLNAITWPRGEEFSAIPMLASMLIEQALPDLKTKRDDARQAVDTISELESVVDACSQKL